MKQMDIFNAPQLENENFIEEQETAMKKFDDDFDKMLNTFKTALIDKDFDQAIEIEVEMRAFYVNHMMWDYKLWFPNMSDSDISESEAIFSQEYEDIIENIIDMYTDDPEFDPSFY